jgi:hypothetical protein
VDHTPEVDIQNRHSRPIVPRCRPPDSTQPKSQHRLFTPSGRPRSSSMKLSSTNVSPTPADQADATPMGNLNPASHRKAIPKKGATHRRGRPTDWRVTAPNGHAAVWWVSERGRPRSPDRAGRSKPFAVPSRSSQERACPLGSGRSTGRSAGLRPRRSSERRLAPPIPGLEEQDALRRTRHRGQTSGVMVANRGVTEYPQW